MRIDFNTMMLLALAVVNLITLIITKATANNIATLEKNTNSKMDALLISTAKASQAEGKAEGLQQGRSETKTTEK